MANEATEVAAAVVEKQRHKLERKWSFWVENKSRGGAWGSTLRKVYTFETVEEFWCLYDQILIKPGELPGSGDMHLFNAGIEPKWEDPECADGGKWTVTDIPEGNGLDKMWVETLMALIGEQFDEMDDICGVVVSVRCLRENRLALWTRKATNKATQIGIGTKWKEIINVNHKITYSFHANSARVRFISAIRYYV